MEFPIVFESKISFIFLKNGFYGFYEKINFLTTPMNKLRD